MSARLFIRNDDVWRHDRSFKFFFDLAIGCGIPVVHAVIPGRMESGLVRFLCRAREKSPGLIDIVQHGWLHEDHSAGSKSKYEFGAKRSMVSQREDIRTGLKKMRLAFGDDFTPAFVPPYHGYDGRTLRVLQQDGFRIFSAGTRRIEAKARILELPAQVSFSRYSQGVAAINPAREVLEHLARGIHRRPLTGVLTHHADFATVASRRQLEKFFDCIAALKAKEGWRVVLFSEIISGLGAS
jgi:peptidoglycan/xylan/chitin deacetylase (PgdA/CDA1 family)